MADRPTLSATSRDIVGKKVARMRREGRIPAVVFGHGRASTPVSVDAHELALLRRRAAASALVDLSVDGKRSVPVIIHGVQLHPVTQRPLHVDLFAVRMTEELTVDVPIVGTGDAPAIDLGGTLVHPLTSLKVKALPANLPEALYYDLSTLVDFDTTITVADVRLPDDVALVHGDLSEVVAKVMAPRVEERVVTEAAEGAEGAEGGAAEPEAAEQPEA